MSAPSRTPELSELRSLVAAADSGTLGRAALRLHISQPALTKRLQALEATVGTTLFERSRRGVTLTPAGRRLYEHARPLLAAADVLDATIVQMRLASAPIRLASSHSAAEAFVMAALSATDGAPKQPVELVVANSIVARGLVHDGRADIAVCAGRPSATPNPDLSETPIVVDEIVCAVPRGHPWAQRGRIRQAEFLRTPMVVRDPSSNARWTVEAVLRREELRIADPLAEAPTPAAALQEALARNAPVLLSRLVLGAYFVEVVVDGLRFPRSFELVQRSDREPSAEMRALMEALRRAAAERVAATGS
ncbi:MAG: LysR family transcriptional regulator [Solirubrobacteraceae bacterium]